MSNEVYGYVVLAEDAKPRDCDWLSSCLDTPLGVLPVVSDELYGLSAPYVPTGTDIAFMVSDSPESRNATYLIDLIDYADDAEIGLPHAGRDRLALLAELVQMLFSKCHAVQVVLAVTDSSQVEQTKSVSVEAFPAMLVEDSEEMAPPSCLYVVRD